MSVRPSQKRVVADISRSVRKPSERVVEYLLAEFDRPDRKAGSRLPTVRQLAGHLQVSVPTVHGVIRKLAREGRVRTEKGSGTFLVMPERTKKDRLTIALGMPAPGSPMDNPWHHGIYGGMLSAALRSAAPVSFLSASSDSMLDLDVGNALLTQRAAADGLILFPFNRLTDLYDEIRSSYEKEGKPVVTMHPATVSATMNFVSPDYFECCSRIAQVWKQTGRRHIVFLMIQSFEVSTSARLRWSGLVNGLGMALGDGMTCRAIPAGGLHSSMEESAYRGLKAALDRRLHVDAVFAAGDVAAMGAIRALREAGLRVPEDVSVVGNTGLDWSDTPFPALTRTRYSLATIGEQLLGMLLRRIERKATGHNDIPGVFCPATYVGGATTRIEENALLGIQPNGGR